MCVGDTLGVWARKKVRDGGIKERRKGEKFVKRKEKGGKRRIEGKGNSLR